MKMTEKIKLLLSKGKIKLALEFFIQLTDKANFVDLHDDAILNLSRLVGLENKILKGIINFENADIVENQIRLATLKLINNFDDLQIKNPVNQDEVRKLIQRKENYSLIGKWYCDFYDPTANMWVKTIWSVNQDNTSVVDFFDMKDNFLVKFNHVWKLRDNIFSSHMPNGDRGKGLIEWINSNKFIFTVLSNSKDPIIEDLAKIYTRIE